MDTYTAFIHYRNTQNAPSGKQIMATGGHTVAIQEQTASNTIVFAISRCSKHDVFCKKTGREIAAGRLAAHHAGRSGPWVYAIPAQAGVPIKSQVHSWLEQRGILA